ncbi:MAG: pirin family protein [Elusimicrobia bacterium]|nr:pirin family protein [Elusimicrobiota bacterium]
MKQPRKIASVWKSQPTLDGAGVRLRRAFGFQQAPRLDPFLLLDDFDNDDPKDYIAGFPWHPHRGIETVTYVLEGAVEHGDSLGNKGVIHSGDVQWMTAGGGIIHQEMPKPAASGRQWGLQLWVNLPRSHKMMEPRYREVLAGAIPAVESSGAVVKVVCGVVDKVAGPVRGIVTEPEYLDVSVPAGGVFRRTISPGRAAFAYVLSGRAYFDRERDAFAHEAKGAGWWDTRRECMAGRGSLVLYDRPGEGVEIAAEDSPVRFLLVSGRPLAEPVAWYGPIVMNTQDELKAAFAQYRDGAFLKHSRPAEAPAA